jgi:hypothetical protein
MVNVTKSNFLEVRQMLTYALEVYIAPIAPFLTLVRYIVVLVAIQRSHCQSTECCIHRN